MSAVETTILPGEIVNIKLKGDFTNDKHDEVVAGITKAREIIEEQVEVLGGEVPCLLDMTEFTGKYDPEILMLFIEFARQNKENVSKTAVFGVDIGTKLVAEAAADMAERDNIDVYPTREEALNSLVKDNVSSA